MKDLNGSKARYLSFDSLGIDNSTLLDAVNDAVILMKGVKFIDCNKKAVEVFGFKNKEQLINVKPYEVSPLFQQKGISSKDLAEKKIDSALKGSPQFFEWKHKRADGEIFDAEISLNMIRKGSQKLLVAVVRDISRRKKSESINRALFNISKASVESHSLEDLLSAIQQQVNTLMDARNFYVALIKNLKKGLFTIPFIVDENPEELCSPDEVFDLSDGFTDYVVKKGKPLLANKELVESLKSEEVKLIGTDSQSWLGVPLRAAGGNLIGVVTVQSYTDPMAYTKTDEEVLLTISSTIASAIIHKRAEESIRYSEKRFKRLSEAAEEGLVFYGKGRIILDSNRTFLKMSGYKLGEINGKSIDYYLHSSSIKIFLKKEKSHRDTPVEVKMLKKNKEILYCLVNIKTFKSGPNGIKVASFKDISSLKKIEIEKRELTERLIRSEKMEALGRLAGGVAHDLNNVLMGIVNYPDLIVKKVDEKEFVIKSVKKIKESGLKAAAIVDDLLTLARRGVSRIEVFNLNSVIDRFFESPEFEKIVKSFPRVTFKKELDSGLLNMRGSVIHLNSTIMNLIFNAAEAIKKRGLIKISTKNIKSSGKLFGNKGDDYIMLTVSDDGVGMDEEEQKKIFEPFYTKKILNRKGTGLGMSVIWGTVKDHNGFINIRSSKGKGSTFELFFPASKSEVGAISVNSQEKIAAGKGERILVVDDEENALDIACQYLKDLNYKPDPALSGEEAIILCKKNRYDLVILDMLMPPGIDGLETYKRIVELRKDIKVLIASGFSENSRVREVLKSGRARFIQKPYSFEKLMFSVNEMLNE